MAGQAAPPEENRLRMAKIACSIKDDADCVTEEYARIVNLTEG